MKTFVMLITWLFPLMVFSQFRSGEDVAILTRQNDDIYLSGEDISIDAAVNGDVVAAGAYITVNDSIAQDLIVAGGEVMIRGYVADDIRIVGGTLTIDSEVGDDVIVAGGEIIITSDAVINGNLIIAGGKSKLMGTVKGLLKARAGKLEINGTVQGDAEIYGEDVEIDGKIYGSSKIVGEELKIGENAQFHKGVSYWSDDGEIDFKDSMINAAVVRDENLKGEHQQFPWKFFGFAALGFWAFYLFSSFLVILILNYFFAEFFTEAAGYVSKELWKGFGYGLIYLFGLPLLIVLSFLIIIGIPVSLFLLTFYLFSIVFGHLAAALLLTYYLEMRNGQPWGYWKTCLVALAFAIVLRVLTFIPFLGGLISLLVMALAYGLLAYSLWQRRNYKKLKIAE